MTVHSSAEPFRIQSRRVNDAVVLTLEGALVQGPALALFTNEARIAVRGNPPVLVLNLARVPRVDSAGLGELILLQTVAVTRGVKVVLAEAGTRVRDLLAMTRVDAIFSSYPDERAALELR